MSRADPNSNPGRFTLEMSASIRIASPVGAAFSRDLTFNLTSRIWATARQGLTPTPRLKHVLN